MRKSLLPMALIASTLWLSPTSSRAQGIDTHGFFDLEVKVSDKDAAGKKWTFDQHHLNVISSVRVHDRFSLCWEVEWEHAPMFSSSSMTGNIYIARSYVEYKRSDALVIWAGKFMAPFGIYNERHDATPTFLFTVLPQSVYGRQEFSFGGMDRIFARHGTGVQIRGNLTPGNWAAEYHAYIINGRGYKPDEIDGNTNKGIGFRIVLKPPVADVRLGSSFYSDKNGIAHDSRQRTLGFDADFYFSDFHAESELLLAAVENVDSTFAPNGKFQHKTGFYLLAAYTFFKRLTPFVRYEVFDPNTDAPRDRTKTITAGLNLSLSMNVYLKSEAHFYRYSDRNIRNYRMFVSSIAVAF